MNAASYWQTDGSECLKVEFGDGVKTFTLPVLESGKEYSALVLKAGSGSLANQVILAGLGTGDSFRHQTGKDLSHAIYCTVAKVSTGGDDNGDGDYPEDDISIS